MAEEPCIHVVEDDRAMRESLVTLLEDAGYKVCSHAMAEDLLHVGHVTESGCVVSDVRMPGMDGLTLLRRLRSRGSGVPLVLITGHGDIAMAVAAMKAGATDFLEKPFQAETLLESIEAALRADVDPEKSQAAKRRLSKLTSREYEVLERLVSGESNKEAAANLGISPRTIEFHRTHIMEKTGAKGLPDLVRLWLATQGAR
jgi:two-component system, LuxR family, response regulator FixJ